MKSKTRQILFFFFLLTVPAMAAEIAVPDRTVGERMTFLISPMGKAEYRDQGLVELPEGKKARVIVFTTHVWGFDDTETIICDPQNLLPWRIERRIKGWFGREHIIEEYDQNQFSVTIKKIDKKGRVYNELVIKKEGPIQNAILLPFYPRTQKNLAIGWRFTARLPNEFVVTLNSIEETKVPAGRFPAYHFTSEPEVFEIWISQKDPQVPLKVISLGKFRYNLYLKEYHSPKSE